MPCIEAHGLRKAFGTTIALDGIDLRVEEGRILGLIGRNGAGKTTALKAILGLTSYQGELKVLERDPWTERDQLMREVCFIADVAVLPRWLRVAHALDFVIVNAGRERSAGDPHDSNRCEVDTRDAGPTIDGQPHLTRVLGTKAVEPESGEQAEDTLGDALGHLSQRMVLGGLQCGQGVQPTPYVLTWNCTHIANAAIRDKIERTCREAGYEPPIICTPEELME